MSKAQAQSLRTVRFLGALPLTSCLPPRSGCLDKTCGLVGMAAPQFAQRSDRKFHDCHGREKA